MKKKLPMTKQEFYKTIDDVFNIFLYENTKLAKRAKYEKLMTFFKDFNILMTPHQKMKVNIAMTYIKYIKNNN